MGINKVFKCLLVIEVLFGLTVSNWGSALLFARGSQAINKNANTTDKAASLLVVRTNHTYKAKVESLKLFAAKHNLVVESQSVSKLSDLVEAKKIFSQFDIVLFDGASKRESKKQFEKFAPLVEQSSQKFLALKWIEKSPLSKGINKRQANNLYQYYDNGGEENLSRMADYVANKVLRSTEKNVDAPIVYPEVGIYHPEYQDLIFSDLKSYLSWNRKRDKFSKSNQPLVGIMMQRALVESSQTSVVDATIRTLEKKGISVLPFFFEVSPQSSPYQHLLQEEGKTLVDVIINFRTIHWANKRKAEFEKIGVPVLQALTYFNGNQQEWEADVQGISPGMTPFMLILPETAGVIDPTIIAARNKKTERSEVIDYQLDHLINKAINIASLKRKPNKDKKLTVFFWGDRDMGASFLNVPDSLHVISHELNKQGYQVEGVEPEFYTEKVNRILDPFYRDFELDELLEEDLAELMPVSDYLTWFNQLPSNISQPIIDEWGEAKNNFMVVKRDGKDFFVLPRIRNGNVLVLRQPPRADDKDQDKMLYHKGEIPMNHYYLAAYYYARKYWNSDAIIHLGTHGSQEYLGGKERGLSKFDGPNLAIWDTPVFYPFIVDDVGEAMQTKRRGSATVISHMTPPFAAAGLQGDSADIHELMHQYKMLDEGGVKVKTGDEIIDHCVKSKICEDFGWSEAKIRKNFSDFLEALHDYLGELAAENQPLGLHSFGELAEQRLMTSTLLQMLGSEFVERAAVFESKHYKNTHVHHHGDDKKQHSHSHKNTESNHQDPEGHFHELAEEIESLAGYKTVRDFIIAEQHGHSHDLSKALQADIDKGRRLYKNLNEIKELEYLVAGLAGKYVPVKTGGDPIRHPESVPTGFNLYGFDPSRLPTKAAFKQGKELVEQVISDYYLENGKYPDKLAFSLWSIEAMRHFGVLESQALYAMGVKPQWSEDGRVIGTEIIPASELKRPRVDIVLSATGLYRDAFPNVVQRLASAIKQITELKEANNSVWDNSQRIKANLISEGYSEDEAVYLSSIRIFSNASGQYGSGTDGPVFASDTWENDKKIADNYLSKMGAAFGTDPKRWGEQLDGLDLYGKQLSGTDVAMFSRSSNIYGMLSSDDPFEYFGSLALAVRNLDGKSPKMMISNLRNATKGKMEDAAQFLAKELRTRQFHKRWIQEMQKEGYSGAVAMASQVANFWGWQVVDPNLVRDDQWQSFHEIYVEDKLKLKMNEWFERVNPGAQAQLIEKMLEAIRKDYWQASQETQRQLIERYLDLVNQFDWFVDNEKLREFVNTSAGGFGLDQIIPVESVSPSISEQLNSPKTIEGQKLEKVEPTTGETDWNYQLLMTLLVCVLVMLLGAVFQAKRSYKWTLV
ncbi:cobaltochelatase subunit CobN [Aliikangiella sp. IMCC44359]|uniref:cobaltochelatase subunit CobN n=1 Tax=Aliikangiella sp. IMCC44359 TaxID=3459125 RepID=UPI00403B1F1D